MLLGKSDALSKKNGFCNPNHIEPNHKRQRAIVFAIINSERLLHWFYPSRLILFALA